MEMITCKGCGKEINRTVENCPFCGRKTRYEKDAEDSRQRITALYFRLIVFTVCAILLLFCLSGCKAEKKGLIDKGNYRYYVIDLPSGEIEKYFTPEGEPAQAAYTDVKTTSSVVVNYVPITEGGWIAYTSNTLAYIPSEAGESGMKSACIYIAMNSNNSMTIQAAKRYIPWLDS